MNKIKSSINNILHINAEDFGGGAAAIARSLMQRQQASGLRCRMAVGTKMSSAEETNFFRISDYESSSFRQKTFAKMAAFFQHQNIRNIKGTWRLAGSCNYLVNPTRRRLINSGSDITGLMGTADIANAEPKPDIIHCHNLHGGYFQLDALPKISQKLPTVITLHDRWTTTGHCAHPLECERWQTGCGQCPNLALPPAIPIDRTADNYRQKRQIFSGCKLYVATPCSWLARKIRQSILNCGVEKLAIIHNGVDTDIFKPGNSQQSKENVDLPDDKKIVLFAASGAENNPWKDIDTLRQCTNILCKKFTDIAFVVLGCRSLPGPKLQAQPNMLFRPFTDDLQTVADYYRAADIYLHAARAETFPNVILESLACGTPVVATNVGGIAEQIRCITDNPPEIATGVLCEKSNAKKLADAAEKLLTDNHLRNQLSTNAAEDARSRFSLKMCCENYMKFYSEAVENFYCHN